jgi:hypothetical protein
LNVITFSRIGAVPATAGVSTDAGTLRPASMSRATEGVKMRADFLIASAHHLGCFLMQTSPIISGGREA